MQPHPFFENCNIPSEHLLGAVRLKALNIEDVERDYEAVMQSAKYIKAANPDIGWPDGLTREKNLVDLAWHQKEFETNRSFAWIRPYTNKIAGNGGRNGKELPETA